jgi:putative transposase
MPWKEASPVDQRTQFIADYLRDVLSITELCGMYGVTRKTGYKWIDRYLRQGPAGLEERARRPRRSPNQTSDEIVAAILDARRRHPTWGGKKLLALLHKRHPRWDLPGRSTACDILSRYGMVPTRRQRRRIGHPGKPTSQILAPTTCGARTSRASSGRGMASTAIPSQWLMGSVAISWAARL